MIKKLLKSVVPPIFLIIYHYFVNKKLTQNDLFDGDDVLFKNQIKDIKIYGEYGCGKSTNWVLNNTSSKILSVDTSSEWIEFVEKKNQKYIDRLKIFYINLGAVGDWGRPINYDKCNNFVRYTDQIWQQNDKPDLVLIDGRFRVCCFLTSLKYADEGTKIIFDDYILRPHYHFIEKYVNRIESSGRQCLFIVPKKNQINFNELNNDINYFRYVMD